ncbi:winged helix-turn-helix transcriptional regulator [Leekyejoonella antrihumi]|uniref:Helix-turn-helix transcriptional regulator n=1 Tax=Leekyejoonella antrihumi TaxID=1660198 RepID=A0A563DUE4_9MICO|nr:helix-turn-helix domain-containing protein [Leekyejoonella antrihumi]TWP33878.1 helix-turn-helix transcriptional regulator [Leekyejoonella antrihumi]
MSAQHSPLVSVDVPGRPCSVAAALDLVGDRWSLLAVREVTFGNRRFSQIARNTGAPRDRLAARLKELVQIGILERRRYQDSPPRSDYHLTQAGRELAPVLRTLLEWGDKWAVHDAPLTLMHRDHELRSQVVCATCGEVVHARDVDRTVHAEGWDLAGPV